MSVLFLQTQYFYKALREFLQIWHKSPSELEDESIRILLVKHVCLILANIIQKSMNAISHLVQTKMN